MPLFLLAQSPVPLNIQGMKCTHPPYAGLLKILALDLSLNL